jgi:glycine/D-amino acid oxidase-like deaminating enzyme
MYDAFKVVKNKPYLIVGQGLAGTILAHHFLAARIPFEIWDAPTVFFNSSQAAGGIFNPVTGRKLEKTWLAEELFAYLPSFYKSLEQTLQASFFHPMPLFRPFANAEMRSWLEDRRAQIDHDYLAWTEDGVWVREAGWVDVYELVRVSRVYFQSLGIFQERAYSESDTFERVIFCEGFHGQQNPLWSKLPFLPAKGELMLFESEQPSTEYILNKNGFILPLSGNQFKVGATYRWDEFSNSETADAQTELKGKLNSMGVDTYSYLETRVGVRPATQDRRPFIGMHPQLPYGIFNGFGSKGVSLTPYFAHAFVEEIQGLKELPLDVSIRRFAHLFSL